MENDRAHRHFEEEAGEYDDIIVQLGPHYRQMVEVLAAILPYRADQAFHAVDLGCGTGMVARSVCDVLPREKLTCVDVAANMLELAGNRLGPDVELLQADFESLRFPRQYDAVVSSLGTVSSGRRRGQAGILPKNPQSAQPGGDLCERRGCLQ